MPLKIKLKKTELELAVEKVLEVEGELRATLAKLNRISSFRKYQELLDAKEVVVSKLKDAARVHSEPGKTFRLVETDEIFVQVSGKQGSVEYDFEKAGECWPSEVLAEVVVASIDNKKVEALLEQGKFKDELASLAAKPREALTPSVTVRFLGEGPC